MRPVVVIGDSLLDVDLVGRASRLTPDAPAPVLDDLVEHARPGGAALAALLLARGGREVVLVTSWSDDDAGARLSAMAGRALTLHRVPGGGTTPVKRRVRAGGQTLLRLDTGGVSSPHGKLEAHTLAILREAAAILVSDYGRGLAALEQVRRAVSTYRTGPVVWDPHPRGPAAVPGARLVTPNAAEVTALTGVHEPAAAGHALADRWSADSVAVTLGDEGALLSTRAAQETASPPRLPCAWPRVRSPAKRSPTLWCPPPSSWPPVPPARSTWHGASRTSSSRLVGGNAHSWRPAVASTCCMPGTSPPWKRHDGWATGSSSA
jgi:bifunctional ADP-heptose synthase (sugar kinase/adenylyltransferase)